MYSSLNLNLDSILQAKPSTWDSLIYTGKSHITVTLSVGSCEYNEIKEVIRSQGVDTDSISSIERVQHPFAYARFLIRKEQLEIRGDSTNVSRKFYKVLEDEAIEALECNMDSRKLSSLSSFSIYSSISSKYCIIITKKMETYDNERDSEEYPEYIIYFQ